MTNGFQVLSKPKGEALVPFASILVCSKLLPQLVEELKKLGRGDILVVVGGVIPAQDYDFLYEHGACAIFGPGTVIPLAAKKIMNKLL